MRQGAVQTLSSLSQQPQQPSGQHGAAADGSASAGLRARGHGSAPLQPEQPPATGDEDATGGAGAAAWWGAQGGVGPCVLQPPLLASAPRGVAVALGAGGKAVVLDLQEDEEGEGEEEGGGEMEDEEMEEDAGMQ